MANGQRMVTGFLHPGEMGASLAAVCRGDRLWCGDGRSAASRARADAAGLEDVGSLESLARRADVIISVCPPGAASDVADAVSSAGFDGIYVDVNAISPTTALSIGERFGRFVDGGVVGPPVRSAGSTRLYLSGEHADDVAGLWADTRLGTRVVEGGAGAASAVKVCFAAWTKGSAALLLAIRALAVAEGVEEALLAEWAISMPDLAVQSERAAVGNAPKAWRFAGELDEIAATFAADGLPEGFGRAAAEVYERLAGFKDTSGATLHAVIEALNQAGNRTSAGGRLPIPPE
jgi:3-hydroxyisobutyrate dehydrogenase-like beta-hydroxyacid dehydrogenase